MAESKEEILRKLFIGGLSRDTTDATFRDYFENYGELVDCVIIRDSTKASRGFGFVTFANEDELLEVLKLKSDNGHVIDGKSVDVKRAIPRDADPEQREKNNKIFLGGLSRDTTEETIQRYFESKFKCQVESVDLIYEKKDSVAPGMQPQKRGFGFVTINDFDIVDHICVLKHHKIDDKDVEVKKASPKENTNRRGGRSNFSRGGGGRGGGGDRRYNNHYNNGGYNQGGYGGNSGGGGGGYNQYGGSYGNSGGYGSGGGGGGYNQYGGQGGDYNSQGYGGGYNEGGYNSYGGSQNYGGSYQNSNYSGAEKSTGRGGKYSGGTGGGRGGYRPY